MKKLSLVLLLACSAGGVETRSSSLTEPGLVAAWGFDETSGSTAVDATCNGHAATLAGQTHVAGKFGNALSFSSNMATVADAVDLRMTNAITIEAWVKPHSPGFSFFGVLAKERSTGYSYALYANTNTGWPRGAVYVGSAKTENGWFGLTAETWQHVALTYDKAHLHLYVNGVLVDNPTVSATTAITTSTNPLRIGRGLANEWFQGSIDEVRIYNRALSASEIAANMNQPVGTCGGGTGGSGGSADGGAGGGGSAGSGASGATGGAGTGGTSGTGGSPQDGGMDAAAGTAGGPGGTSGASGGSGSGGSAGSGGSGGTTAGPAYPLKLASGQRYLVDQNGVPFMVVGEAAWSLVVSVSTADADAYLADRQARGFNTVLVNLIEHKFTTQPAPKNAAGDLPFTGTLSGGARDFSTPNDAYFAHVDAVLNAAAARGIQVLLDASYLGYQGGDEGWYSDMQANGTARLTTYGTYVGNRYKTFPNIVWVNGGDYNPPDPSGVNAVGNAIQAADPNHVMTAHASETPAEVEYGWASWEQVNNVYAYPASGNFIYAATQAQYTRPDWQPLFLIESTYEHNPFTPPTALLVRQQAYEAVLNGGFGQLFGNEWVWPFGAAGVDGTTHDWRANLDSQGAGDVSRLAALLLPRRWDMLVPDLNHALLTGGSSSGSAFASAALTTDGKLGLVYVPAVRDLTVDMSRMAGSTTARWYSPTTGAFTTVSGSPFANVGSHVFNPGSGSDWVLVLESP